MFYRLWTSSPVSPLPEPQIPITDPATSRSNHHREELKDEMMKKKIKPSTLEKRKIKANKKEIMNNDEASSSSSSSSTTLNPNSTRRISRVAYRMRNPPVRLGMARRSVGERQAEALALPLGMSFAAFANLVLERASAVGQNVHVDDLAVFSTSAVKESLANVYGDKLGSFATNFERSFKSTLRILKLINAYATPKQLNDINVASFDLDCSTIEGCSDDTELSAEETSSAMSAYEAIQGSARTTCSMNEIVLHEENRQLIAVPRSSAMSLTTIGRSFLEEQARANDLKREENDLTEKKLRWKEMDLAATCESNNLKKCELQMAVSDAKRKEEKFERELEDKRKADMVVTIMDWLVVSVFIMLSCMSYGAYVFSQKRIMDDTSICKPPEDTSSSWWFPKQVSWINTALNILICRFQVWAQRFLAVLMIFVFTYLLFRHSSGTKPISFIVLFLGVVCGLTGKLCVDAFGGDGKLWLILWEMFCVLQLVANVFTLDLSRWIYGPISMTHGENPRRFTTWFPYWVRKSLFFGVIWLVLPLTTGLLPFATFGEWRDHVKTYGEWRDYVGVLVSLWWGSEV